MILIQLIKHFTNVLDSEQNKLTVTGKAGYPDYIFQGGKQSRTYFASP